MIEGDFVNIVYKVDKFYRRKWSVEILKVPGRIRAIEGESAWVYFYGEATHFGRLPGGISLYCEKRNLVDLEIRQEEMDDPMEFYWAGESAGLASAVRDTPLSKKESLVSRLKRED